MRPFRPGVVAVLLLVTSAPVATAGTTVVLDCDFDDKTVDAVIGTGGAAAGEPVDRDGMAATVRAAPLPTPCLEILDAQGSYGPHLRFGLLGDAEITQGTLDISATLQFATVENYDFTLREQGGAAVSFLDILFRSNGTVRCGDFDTPTNPIVGSYTAGTPLALHVVVHLDTWTYDFSLGGVALVTGESMGSPSRGIGTVLVGVANDPGDAGSYFLDDLVVTATDVPSPVTPTTWAGVKAAWR